jgi:hypothetical protein
MQSPDSRIELIVADISLEEDRGISLSTDQYSPCER